MAKSELKQPTPETALRVSKSRSRKSVAAVQNKITPSSTEVIEQESQLEAKQQPENNPIEVNVSTKRIVEAILFAANRCMTAKQIQQVFPELEQPEIKQIQAAIDSIMEDYNPRPVGLKKLASGYRFQVKEGMSPWVSRLFEEKPPRYSRALLETLAIIVYRQPVTRGEIEEIRGVGVSSYIVRTLLDREWIRIIAHKEVPGRPALYGTTKNLLDYFNLSSLDEMPTLEEIQDLDLVDEPEPTEQSHSEKQKATSTEEESEQETEANESVQTSTSSETQTDSPDSHTLH